MIIRKATAHDIPGIVELLRISLGESLMPKSEAFWNWKHIQNPFGESPVLLALEGEEIIGVRAFMRWEWKQGDTVYKSVRAVDTATHPNHQGKGIFKKLTLALLEECKTEKTNFVFNTPNQQSMPGYLKMGWLSLGKLPVRVAPVLPIGFKSDRSLSFNKVSTEHIANIVQRYAKDDILRTNYSPEYLNWRYGQNPNMEYRAVFSEQEYLAVYRIKKFKVGNELRITDFFCNPDKHSTIAKQLKGIARQSKVTVISVAGTSPLSVHPAFKLGPYVTVRNISMQDFENRVNFAPWKPSLGDLEVF